MTAPNSLHHFQVLLLRQNDQAQELVDLVKSLSGQPIVLPVMRIVPIDLSAQKQRLESTVRLGDFLVVASSNAVTSSPEWLLDLFRNNTRLKIITMGERTSATLRAHQLNVHLSAPPGTTSETLLSQAVFDKQNIENKNILLLAGTQGRTVIAQGLQDRCAHIEWIQTYQQERNEFNCAHVQTQHKKVILISLSGRALEFFKAGVSLEQFEKFIHCPLIVISERLAKIANSLGFKHTIIADSPLSADIKTALLRAAEF